MNDSTPDAPIDRPTFLPTNWQELAPLVDAVLDAPAERRAQLLDELCAGDAAKRAELERLVHACEGDTALLDRQAGERFHHLLDVAPEAPLPDVLNERYRIERELGRGGMARVYLAHDIKHARSVAVKVIRPELAASLGRDRFLREIRIAAQLHHPNIVALYDSGDANGVLYFVMPYEDGPSLRTRLTGATALSVAECVSVLRDVARALAYAHDRGIVHRDVKPDNVMLCGGAAVVTDFGIAKAVSVAQGETLQNTLTQAGTGLGTAAYMAPEQAVGDPSTDHRADIYSFGCLAYELFTGKPPFHDMPTHQIIAAHVSTRAVPIADVCATIPDGVARVIDRCLAKNPDDRPQSAHTLLAELDTASTMPHDVVRRWRPSRTRLIGWSLVAVACIGALLFAARQRRAPSNAQVAGPLTLAVLPLRSLGGDSLHVDMADGFSDEVATALRKAPGVHVMSRPTVGRYSGQRELDLQQIGRDLGAKFLVMGSLRWNVNRLTATVKLVEAANLNNDLWSDVIDRDDGDFSVVRDSIVRSIERTLQSKFGASSRPAAASATVRHVNQEAFRLYLLAQGKLNKRGLNVQASADLFRKATALDSNFAPAFSGLALALALTPYFHPISSREVADEATRAAMRARTLDSTLAQPHVALGLVHEHAYQWADAQAEFLTAIRLRTSDDVESLVQYGRYLVFRGRNAEGLTQFLLARETDPASALVSSWASYAYYLRGMIDSAYVESERAYQSDSTNITTVILGALVRLKAGRTNEARAFMRSIPPLNPVALYVLAVTGDTAEAIKRLAMMENNPNTRWLASSRRAFVMMGAGDTARAIDAFERATDLNENWPTMQSFTDPIYDPIRSNPRFQRLLQRIGLMTAQ